MRGLRAIVLPAQQLHMPVAGGMAITQHPMLLSFNTPDTEVRLADFVDKDFLPELRTQVSCEDWLREAPETAALRDAKRVLGDLLPGLVP
jgi:hypothetical protein